METQQSTPTQSSASPFIVPASIVLAGVLVAGAVFFTKGDTSQQPTPTAPENTSAGNVREVNADDHILGDPNAPVKIIEYSDLECPFCKRFHETMKRLIGEYGESGQVAWVYRHFPLTSIHSGALPAAIASECAAEIGGNVGFWAFVDRYFETTDSTNSLNANDRTAIAEAAGIDRSAFASCVSDSDRFSDRIEQDAQNAVDSGGQGTPYSIIIAANGEKIPVNGAVSYQQLKSIIDQALQAQSE